MAKRPNVLVLMSDSHNTDALGAYGNQRAGTPALDRLAASGTRFDRAYTTCPLCTPARGGLFSGVHPQVGGASYNGVSLYSHIPHAGEYFRRSGYRTAYTGKWHLDGDYPYMGSGQPAEHFEPEWWYDGQNYHDDIGDELFALCYKGGALDRMDSMPEDEHCYWGHRVASRAIDFIDSATGGDDPFFLVASFDEPHGPYCAPPQYYREVDPADLPHTPMLNRLGANKPQLQQLAAARSGVCPPEDVERMDRMYLGCMRFLDAQIGRVLDRLETAGLAEDTIVVYTSDHGQAHADYRMWGKGYFMYERVIRIPLLIAGPGITQGAASASIVSHIDVLPTLLAAAGISWENPLYAAGAVSLNCPPEQARERNSWIDRLHGIDLAPVLRDPTASVRDYAHVSFDRFGNMPRGGGQGNFHPIRCVVGRDHKLAINAFDLDEFYDLGEDPWELENRIMDPAIREPRNAMHQVILDHLDAITDPLRGHIWGHRPWQSLQAFGHPW